MWWGGGGGGGGGVDIQEGSAKERVSRFFRSPEAGISREEVDLTIGCVVLCILNRHELQKDRERVCRRT